MKKKNYLLLGFLALLSFNTIFAQCAPKMVLFEQSCFKDCGPCIGHQYEDIDPLYAKNKDKIAMVVYTQAPVGIGTYTQKNLPYASFYETFNMEYQSLITADRTFLANNYNSTQGPTSEAVEDAKEAFETQYNSKYSPVSVDISSTYDAATRKVNVKLTANFCDTASGDLRFYLVLTQDTVIGPKGIAYAQNVNATAGTKWNGYDVVSFAGSGGAWLESYPFKDAVKYQPSGFFGNAGIIPQKPVIGKTYTENYSFTLPLKNSSSEKVDIDAKRIQIVASVVKKGNFKNRQALNSNKKYLVSKSVNTAEITPDDAINLTTNNPVSDVLIVNYSTPQSGAGEINLYNASGEIIKNIKDVAYNLSNSTMNIDVSEFSNGIYFLSLNINGAYHTRKFVINK